VDGTKVKEPYIAVGDIHGCLEELLEVLELCSAYGSHRYVFLGDYIDRGPSSNEVINTIRALDAVYLMGNHE
jgi:serine/threonine protein phosphatase 1